MKRNRYIVELVVLDPKTEVFHYYPIYSARRYETARDVFHRCAVSNSPVLLSDRVTAQILAVSTALRLLRDTV